MQTRHRIMENENKVWYLQHNRLFLDTAFEMIKSEHLFKMTLFPDAGWSSIKVIRRGSFT
jgi:hypothetical protein